MHGNDIDKDAKRKALHEQVTQLYQDPARYYFPTVEKKKLFRLPITQRLKCSDGALISWIDLVETRLRLDREEMDRVTIMRWIGRNPVAEGT